MSGKPKSKHSKMLSAEDLDGDFKPTTAFLPSDSDVESEVCEEEVVSAKAGAGDSRKAPTAAASDKPNSTVVSGKKRKRSEMEEKSAMPESAEAQATMFWTSFTTSKTGERLTDLEISSPLLPSHLIHIPSSAVPTAGKPTNDVSDIASAIKHALPTWKKVFGWKSGASKREGAAPEVLIVTYSAPRAASMLKPLAFFKTRIAKLFAKHLSVEEQKAMLAGPPVTMAVGTPNRLQKLLDMDALSLKSCSLVLVDVHPDMKKYTILQHPNIREDFFLLYRDYLHPKVVEGKMKLALY